MILEELMGNPIDSGLLGKAFAEVLNQVKENGYSMSDIITDGAFTERVILYTPAGVGPIRKIVRDTLKKHGLKYPYKVSTDSQGNNAYDVEFTFEGDIDKKKFNKEYQKISTDTGKLR